MKHIPVAITIAGSDSGGGAGIEADLKTFMALGVHGTVAITSVTAQNTYEVTAIHDIPADVVYKQIEAIAIDMGIDAGKTGMLSNKNIIEAVAKAVEDYDFPLVIDPVMIAKSGAKLLREDAIETLIKKLLPKAKVVTPNAPEASRLTGIKVVDLETARKAAKYLVEEIGVEAAIVKGGHLTGDKSIDILYWNKKFYELEAPRIKDGCTHGTGCAFSAAIAAGLAKGYNVVEAVKKAKDFITLAIDYGLKIGKGHCPVNPASWIEIPAYKFSVIENIKNALNKLLEKGELIHRYVPEVGMNLVMALPAQYARTVNDVAGVLGRIVKYGKTIKPVGPIEFGASSHLARLVLAILKHDPRVRAAVNVKYSEDLVERAKSRGYNVVFIDRRREPEDLKKREGSTMQWIVDEVFREKENTPDIIYDVGDVGKEAMIRVLGESAADVVNKLINIIE
ncbi:MAG: bifunctional hydroxymethylpyrimidine kinase/phosphomethylpyrimidine kinase [Desulfurococcales archaeon ex4484_58]|nr:MAG: bifunctional hydroxymethylpyrimidine kinase/phosphomethylpyrimidine kinase [Desulfurococcales archaeon ex4484_58]